MLAGKRDFVSFFPPFVGGFYREQADCKMKLFSLWWLMMMKRSGGEYGSLSGRSQRVVARLLSRSLVVLIFFEATNSVSLFLGYTD